MTTRGTEPHPTQHGQMVAGEPIGLFHTWWRGDLLPAFPSLPRLTIEPMDDLMVIADLSCIDADTLKERVRHNHEAWIARIENQPVACGWIAEGDLSIGELGIGITLDPTSRYLWDFLTAPSWRGRGIYPRLLQAMIKDAAQAERFWIGHDLGNTASRRGIVKAGFREVGAVFRLPGGELVMTPTGSAHHAEVGSAQFGIRLVDYPAFTTR